MQTLDACVHGGVNPRDMLCAADAEHRRLRRSLHELGPDAPTLCDGWKSIDLARHLVMVARFDGVPALVVNLCMLGTRYPLASLAPRFVGRLGEVLAPLEWSDLLIEMNRPLPRVWAVPGVAQWRFVEYWVHHQDVLRPNARVADGDLGALRAALPVAAMLGVGWNRVELDIRPDDAPAFTVGRGERVVVTGRLAEIAMWIVGRRNGTAVSVLPESRQTLGRSM